MVHETLPGTNGGSSPVQVNFSVGAGGAASQLGLFYQPLYLLELTTGPAAGAQAVVTVGAGGLIAVTPRFAGDPVDIGYAELHVRSLDGTERLGIEADAGSQLVDATAMDWTGYSTLDAAGTDLTDSADGITSTAGGTFVVTFLAYPAA